MCAFVCLFVAAQARAQIRVSPDGVNVSTQAPAVAFLTFGNLNNQVPAEATWCGELIPAAPDIGFKCNPATIFGVIPARYDRTMRSGARGYTDIMTLPASVARRAYQAAAAGAQSSFFFVRRFVSTVGGRDEFVVVTCRMSGGMSGSPFSLTDVRLGFAGVDKPILYAKEGEKLPRVKAKINYTGSGRLKGRWEVVMPGEDPPGARDLLTEATLPLEQRGTQRRYTQLSRFNVFLPPGGKYTLDGPDPSELPARVAGEYLLLLRVEASDDEASESDLSVAGTGQEVVSAGAVAGFPLPILHYFVGVGGIAPSAILQLVPADGRVFSKSEAIDLAWMEKEGAALYRLEVTDNEGKSVLSALCRRGREPTAPPLGCASAPASRACAGAWWRWMRPVGIWVNLRGGRCALRKPGPARRPSELVCGAGRTSSASDESSRGDKRKAVHGYHVLGRLNADRLP